MSSSDNKDIGMQRWEYPDITSDEVLESERKNAINKPMRWRYEPPEPEPTEAAEETTPTITAEMLEQIRHEAQQEGYAEGHSEGLKSGHEEGYQAGFNEGREAGQKAGEEAAQQATERAIATLSERWQALFNHMRMPAYQVSEAVERNLVTMASELAKAICFHEVTVSPDIIQQVVKRAVADLGKAAEKITISLHPDDVALIAERWDEQARKELGWTIEVDSSLQRGGCIVETPITRIDASLGARIDDVLQHFLQGVEPTDIPSMRSEPAASESSAAEPEQAEPEQDKPEQHSETQQQQAAQPEDAAGTNDTSVEDKPTAADASSASDESSTADGSRNDEVTNGRTDGA